MSFDMYRRLRYSQHMEAGSVKELNTDPRQHGQRSAQGCAGQALALDLRLPAAA